MRSTPVRRLITASALLVTVVVSMFAVPAVHSALAASNRPQEYLALGDSVAFGYNPASNPSDASNFIGYPMPAAATLKETLTDAACPGDTSSHMISVAGLDNGCQGFRSHFPLHVDYGSLQTSQLQFADGFLQSHPKTLVVSINVGSNDLFVLINSCGGEANLNCILAGLPAMLGTLSVNLDTIYGHIRNMDGYHHKIVALTYYSLNYSDPVATSVISQVNQVVSNRTLAWGGIVADGFGAFAAASAAFGGDPCAAGLLFPISGGCDIHPSATGRALLAQAIVNALRPD